MQKSSTNLFGMYPKLPKLHVTRSGPPNQCSLLSLKVIRDTFMKLPYCWQALWRQPVLVFAVFIDIRDAPCPLYPIGSPSPCTCFGVEKLERLLKIKNQVVRQPHVSITTRKLHCVGTLPPPPPENGSFFFFFW